MTRTDPCVALRAASCVALRAASSATLRAASCVALRAVPRPFAARAALAALCVSLLAAPAAAAAGEPEARSTSETAAWVLTQVALRRTPTDDAKVTGPDGQARPNRFTVLERGEALVVLETTGGWSRVRASDGSDGWLESRFLLSGAGLQAATLLEPARTFSRPDLVALRADVSLEPGTLLFVVAREGAFAEVNYQGTRTAWVQAEALVTDAPEVGAARLVTRARSVEAAGGSAELLWGFVYSEYGDTALARRLGGGARVVEAAPADDVPADDVPADDVPADDVPADDVPAEAAAADDHAFRDTEAAQAFVQGFLDAVRAHDWPRVMDHFDPTYVRDQHDDLLDGRTGQFLVEALGVYQRCSSDGEPARFVCLQRVELTAVRVEPPTHEGPGRVVLSGVVDAGEPYEVELTLSPRGSSEGGLRFGLVAAAG